MTPSVCRPPAGVPTAIGPWAGGPCGCNGSCCCVTSGSVCPRSPRVLAGQTDDQKTTCVTTCVPCSPSRNDPASRCSVERTIEAIQKDSDGHRRHVWMDLTTRYKQEVEQLGTAYADSDRWWRGLSDSDKQGFLVEDRAIAAAHGSICGTPGGRRRPARPGGCGTSRPGGSQRGWAGRQPSAEAISGIAQMYDRPALRRQLGGPKCAVRARRPGAVRLFDVRRGHAGYAGNARRSDRVGESEPWNGQARSVPSAWG